MNVDTHFHVFDKTPLMQEGSRYSVDYSASIDNWRKIANDQKITGGVIVQPSFLGYDNSYMLEKIRQNPKHLRGIGVVSPQSTREELLALREQGVCGIRLNLSGDQDPLGTLDKNLSLIDLLKNLSMHVQIHHDDGLLNELLLNIPRGIDIVIDHFGRPKTNNEFEKFNAGINRHHGNLWVKLSAQYRTPQIYHQSIFEYWLKKIGASHLLWGSDWPHTRFEANETYGSQMNRFLSFTTSSELRQQILSKNPRCLYWF